jgi:hypothetical protein
MDDILNEEKFDFVAQNHKTFILAFNDEMAKLGYDFGNKISNGACWGKYMIVYNRSGVKSKNVYARIYIRDSSIVLRLFFSQIDKHREYLEHAPSHIKEVFVGDYGKCKHDHDDKDGKCQFRKTYTLDGQFIEKCNGLTFEFPNPTIEQLNDYLALFTVFYPNKKAPVR